MPKKILHIIIYLNIFLCFYIKKISKMVRT